MPGSRLGGLAAVLLWWGSDACAGDLGAGKAIAFAPDLGNCLACHQMDDGEGAGDIGPPLLAMRARFPSREALRRQIWDPGTINPDTRMPPYGRHRILSEAQIDLLVDYLWTL